MNTTDKDLGYKKILDAFDDLESLGLEIGIFGGVVNDEGTSIATYGLYNEFGTKIIPERSFMRSTVDANMFKYNALLDHNIKAMTEGKQTAKGTVATLGLVVENDIRKKIFDLKLPPNALSTQLQKGSKVSNKVKSEFVTPSSRQSQGNENVGFTVNNPLVDTGALAAAIDHQVVNRLDL